MAQALRVRPVQLGECTKKPLPSLACHLEQGQAAPDSTEELAVRRLPLVEAFRMVEAGEIRDAISIMALQAVELLALKGRLGPLLK